MYRFPLCLMLFASTLAAPRPAAAVVSDFYDSVDFVEVDKRNCSEGCEPSLTVRGILAGTSTSITRVYLFTNSGNNTEGVETALHCQRLALLAMSKPGKFQFAIGPFRNASGCRLTAVAH
jgi:hypothetical protein